MPKVEWGVKRICPKCAVRFYDLQNDPMTCPSCEATFDIASLTQQKTRTVAPEKVVAKPEETASQTEVVLDDDAEDILKEDSQTGDANLGDDILDEDDEDTVNLDELTDVPANEDES